MNANFWEEFKQYYPTRKDSESFICPRSYGKTPMDVWGLDDCCSYCGSLDPHILLQHLRDQTVSITPTDKNYKIYVDASKEVPLFKQQYRPEATGGEHPKDWVWENRPTSHAKFYFQHFSKVQQQEFIDLYNQQKLSLKYPGYFYTPPFFMTFKEI